MTKEDFKLSESQLARLSSAFASGAKVAADAMACWVNLPSLMIVESLGQLDLCEAMESLGNPETPIGCCAMQIDGLLSGNLLLAFDDACGWALADLILGQPLGTSGSWTEIERSAAMESTNIIGTNYFNGIAADLARDGSPPVEMIPSPPVFQRDFAQSILQFAISQRAVETETILIAKTRFEVARHSLSWRLVLIPDPDSFQRLRMLLSET